MNWFVIVSYRNGRKYERFQKCNPIMWFMAIVLGCIVTIAEFVELNVFELKNNILYWFTDRDVTEESKYD